MPSPELLKIKPSEECDSRHTKDSTRTGSDASVTNTSDKNYSARMTFPVFKYSKLNVSNVVFVDVGVLNERRKNSMTVKARNLEEEVFIRSCTV